MSPGARERFVNVWMHNGFVRLDEQKMSKSLGNFFTIREILKRYDPEVVRFFVARAHYRSPLNYADTHLEDARQALARLYTALKAAGPGTPGPVSGNADAPDWSEPHAGRFRAAMNDDFNTPEAIASLFDLAGEVNRSGSESLARQLRSLGGLLGLLGREPTAFLRGAPAAGEGGAMPEAEIEALIRERREARAAKNFSRGDQIRAELLSRGIVLEDSPQGTSWRRA